ncbi:phosphatase PAP2 family protein [Fundidesulfovibrio butyratiphilus]
MTLRFAARRSLFVLLTVLLLASTAWTKGPNHYLAESSVNLVTVLAPPPAAGSPAAQADLDVLLALQKVRTPEQEAAALADRERSVFRFADVLGQEFNDNTLAGIALFFERVHATESFFVGQAKQHWKRPRPFLVDPALHPSLPKPTSSSYPSGHSAFGHLVAIVLANMIPEKAPELFARGTRFARQRMVGGVHYPTDIEGGKIAAAVIANALFHDPDFLRDFAQVKTQIRTALKLR